ncbi:hypothetical protein D3C87_1807810 [compost metagenome]
MGLGAQDIGVHEREMRHVEEILDDAQAGRLHRHCAAGHVAAIRLIGFRHGEDVALGGAEGGPEEAETGFGRQRRVAILGLD